MEKIQKEIAEKIKDLFCPPEGIPTMGGKQLAEGNKYPTEKRIDLEKHVSGSSTYALDSFYHDASGTKMCKWGVIDIDENGVDGLNKARQVAEYLEPHGFQMAMAFSGNKGFHVYIVCEPLPAEIMKKALTKVKSMFSFKGEIIPGDAYRCKPAPCLHQVSGNMSYLIKGEPYPENFGIDNLPEGFFEQQLAVLERISPTPANTVAKFAASAEDSAKLKKDEDTVPHLDRLQEDLAPCIKALIDKGGDPTIGTYDKNNLTLAGYCHTRGVAGEAQIQYAEEMARNAENGPVETTKSFDEKIQHFKSILNTPSVKEDSFQCPYMLRARKTLDFNCAFCAARPEGVETRSGNDESGFTLEEPLARDFLAYIIQRGKPAELIAPEIMPLIKYDSQYIPGGGFRCNLYRILLAGINDGVNHPTKMSEWMDINITRKQFLDYFNGDFKNKYAEIDSNSRKKGAVFMEFKDNLIQCYKDLQHESLVGEEEWEKLRERAVDFSMRYNICFYAEELAGNTTDRSTDIYTSSSAFTHEATQILASSQRGTVVPLKDKAIKLLEFITGTGSPRVPTPFRVLNDLFGGGFRNGGLYIIVSSPGGGKTTLSTQCADHAAINGIPVIVISMEMSQEELFVNSIARFGEINSAKIMSPYDDIKEQVMDQVGEAAEKYLARAEEYLYIIEGDHATSPARIEAIVSMVRAQHNMTQNDPLLVVIDYLQLLSTGVEALDYNSNEAPKISELAVKTKQLARDNNVAVLAISDVTKDEQEKVITNKEYTLNSTRGSNRIAHAADVVMGLYSESSADEGGKAKTGPWEMYTRKLKASENAQEFIENMQQAMEDIETGGDGATVFSRLELIKNRAGQGRGSQFMLYRRAYQKFEAVELEGQEKAEGRG
ncbi:MAG: DnaB-like helicase C-terminal domain-containing protein [Bacteroidota bacterium]